MFDDLPDEVPQLGDDFMNDIDEDEEMEIMDEIAAQAEQDYLARERRNDSFASFDSEYEKFPYRGVRKVKTNPHELGTMSFGDITNRYVIMGNSERSKTETYGIWHVDRTRIELYCLF